MSITIRDAQSAEDIAFFRESMDEYFERDMFPRGTKNRYELLDYYQGSDYHDGIGAMHGRETDPAYFLIFRRGDEDIGFSLCATYPSEDAKFYIMEFCVLPDYRGDGVGTACAEALLAWGREHGAAYFELNADDERRVRFWSRLGFVASGKDEWGKPLMLLLPKGTQEITVEVANDPDLMWQLYRLQNSFLSEIGEPTITEEDAKDKKERLAEAMKIGVITYFVARWGFRYVGMCSVAPCFSAVVCNLTGVLDNFYVEPAFRGCGVGRQLMEYAQKWSRDQGVSGLRATCDASVDGIYKKLGFTRRIGTTRDCDLTEGKK